jgi:hypothetical protein
VPLIVITSDDHDALTPAGKPFAPATPSSLIPVAPVVEWEILAIAELRQDVGVELDALAKTTPDLSHL